MRELDTLSVEMRNHGSSRSRGSRLMPIYPHIDKSEADEAEDEAD